jgi:hypothetical protein
MRQVLTITIFSILLLTASVFATGSLFKGQIVSPGSNYYALCASELDNDGDPDLIVTDQNNKVSVLLTHNDGSFTVPVSYELNGSSLAVASADFDGDGYNDIAISREVNGGDEYLGILINNGNGTFAAPLDYASYNNAYDLVTADFDGDDDIDILAATHYYAELYLNNGDGTFAAAVDISAATGMNTGLAAVDLDNDTDIDFAINNYEIDSTQIFLNNGSGVFASAGRYASGNYPYSLTAAQIDNDGVPDLIVSNRVIDSIAVLINNGDGSFLPAVRYQVGEDAYCAEPADLDKDGDIDLAVGSWNGQKISILFNGGTGTFATPFEYVDQPVTSIAATDFDKDGFLDLASIDGTSSVKVMYNKGNGHFYENPTLPVGTNAWTIATGDYDNNGYIDMVVSNYVSNDLSIFLNNGDSTFATETYSGLPIGAGPKGIAIANLDGDPYEEIIVADFLADQLSVKYHASLITVDYVVADGPNAVIATDFDDDGDNDVAVEYENAKVVSIYLNGGGGDLASYSAFSTVTTPYNFIAADLDGDGDKDIAIANAGTYPNYYQHVYFNNGSGSFLTGTTFPSSGTCIAVAAADIDGDSDNDLIYITEDDRIYFYKNSGSGSFADSTSFDLGFTAANIHTGDFDLDGDIDIAVNDRWEGNFVVYYNNGDGNFVDPRYYRVGGYTLGFTGADLDNDGDEDLIPVTTTEDDIDSLKIFWNRKDLIPLDNNDNHHGTIPSLFTLNQNYPNPFNPVTIIDYTLPSRADVTITIFNLLGQTVRTLVNNQQAAGSYSITWDGRDNSGKTAASGLYFYRLQAGDFAESKKMIMLK